MKLLGCNKTGIKTNTVAVEYIYSNVIKSGGALSSQDEIKYMKIQAADILGLN